jgi:predicted nucleic acid-binding protein
MPPGGAAGLAGGGAAPVFGAACWRWTRTADRWGRLQGSAGRPLPAIDSLLAATALQHDLTLVTRNTADFDGMGVRLVNPWLG